MDSKVIFIRHGESLGNVEPSYYLKGDEATILSRRGVDQCLELRAKMPSLMPADLFGNYTQVITSQMIRAKLTQSIVMANFQLKLPVIHDARLNETYHSDHHVHEEDDEEIKVRVRSLIEQHPFNLILFCHGMLMRSVDPAKGSVKNCEYRIYDRKELLDSYLRLK